ncbi:hypothetical protein K1719_014328 [Acacia pycnantha]|nr:hypothetical protein K1719_014328 [Acacia pycnantha]
MKYYISASGIKRVTISNGAAGKGSAKTAAATAASGRRISVRTLLPVVLLLAIVLPFLFVRFAILVLESTSVCSSLDCMGWRFFSGGDASLKLRDELTRVLLEAKDDNVNEGGVESFNDLVNEMVSKGQEQDLRAFAFKTKAVLSQMEHKVQSARQQESVFWHLASHGVPKTLHCLSLKLAEEYAVNAMARSRLPPPEYVSRLVSDSFHHLVLITDNVLAASVVVASVVENVANPEKLVFHIVTDKKTYTPMHAWFATHSIEPAVLEVRGLHQYDLSEEVNVDVREMMRVNHQIEKKFLKKFKEKEIGHSGEQTKLLAALKPSSFSLMNHLRMYIPQLFPDLSKIVLLDDDVVVQHDISSLWEQDLNGKVSGSVFKSWCGDGDTCCPDTWRRTNITQTHLQWLKLNLKSGLALWNPGVLPPALIAFEGHVHSIDSTWLVTDLGYRYQSEEIIKETLQSAAVIHFNGPAKPWLEIGFPQFRSFWNRYVNSSDKFVRRCRITW